MYLYIYNDDDDDDDDDDENNDDCVSINNRNNLHGRDIE